MTANARPRIRDWGLKSGTLSPGAKNGLTDVPGVRVGHETLVRGDGRLDPGRGPVRTGVTVVLPHDGNLFERRVRAAVHTINGYGKVFGFEQVRELGLIEAPIALTSTLNVGLVVDALVQHAVDQNPGIGISGGTVNVVVGETNDGYLNDLQGRHVRAEHVYAAIKAASTGRVAEGAVGAGTGTSCFGWKGGIGSPSRVLSAELGGYTVGALVQTSFGQAEQLTVLGAPVGRYLRPPERKDEAHPSTGGDGSVMVVLGTDAPTTGRQLERLCLRAAAGLARTGSIYHHTSGDFVVGFSTAYRLAREPTELVVDRPVVADEARLMSVLFAAVVESVEEAVLNALWRAETVVGRDGHVLHALPLSDVARLIDIGVLRR